MEKATELRFHLPNVVTQQVEYLVQFWGERSGLKDKALPDLLSAVDAVVEAIVTLSGDLNIQGDLIIKAVPYTQWLTVEITYLREVPLDPNFDMADEVPKEFSEMALHPDIFWRHIIMKSVDKAAWVLKGRKASILLTQYARR